MNSLDAQKAAALESVLRAAGKRRKASLVMDAFWDRTDHLATATDVEQVRLNQSWQYHGPARPPKRS